MNIPGLLIEYLVSGAIALLWLLHTKWEPSITALGAKLPVLVLILYVAGMAIDVMAFALTRQPKKWLRVKIFENYRPNEGQDAESGTERQARITLYAPELGKELAMRSSRDRIARGLIVNSIFATIFVQPYWIGAISTIGAAIMWAGFERLSYGFELCADKVVTEKLRNASKS